MYLWQASASIEILQKRAQLLCEIRKFFHEYKVLEVETPILASSTNPDPCIESFQIGLGKEVFYLQTSPEFHMKRLLASGSGPIYQITKAFRSEEVSSKHNPEFAILEWYQPKMHYHQFMDELEKFLQTFFSCASTKITYQTLFIQMTGLDPFFAPTTKIRNFAVKKGININNPGDLTRKQWLDLILVEIIEPKLKNIVFLYDFPKESACLAKLKPENTQIAERFEIYIHGVEIANGFHELNDINEQRERFIKEQEERKANNQHVPNLDEKFLQSLLKMPECSGVAIGVDRLAMLIFNCEKINDVIAFPITRA